MAVQHRFEPTASALRRLMASCRALIERRFPEVPDCGAAAVLLDDGSILTGTSPDFPNPSTTVCHETEPYCAAFRLNQTIRASVCLHRTLGDRYLVLSPCGVCQERLAMHGEDTLVGVPEGRDATEVQWLRLETLMPHYWVSAFK